MRTRPRLLAIVFSCDRPPQLELLLRSAREQIREWSQTQWVVFIKATEQCFVDGYQRVQRAFPEISFFVEETNGLASDAVREILFKLPSTFVSFFVDDDVIIRPISLYDPPFWYLEKDPDVTALSLRLSPSITYCQPLDCASPPPPSAEKGWYFWRDPSNGNRWLPTGDWAGPLSVDGNIFEYSSACKLFSDFPNVGSCVLLEPEMNRRVFWGTKVHFWREARLVNVAMNRVAKGSIFPALNESPEKLNEQFLRGYRLDGSPLQDRYFWSCHISEVLTWTLAHPV